MPLSRATFALIVANSIVFLITLSQSARFSEPSLQTLISFGANFAPLTIFHGEVWRLFTSMFLHGGWIHLLVNMYSLYVIGAAVDFICGTKKYIMIYIVAGLAGSVASVMYSLVRLKPVVSVGASGAIFGIYALLLTVMWKRNDLFRPEARRNVLKNGALVIGYNLFIGFVAPEIDNAAHVGGFLAGATSGFIIAPKLRRPKLPQP